MLALLPLVPQTAHLSMTKQHHAVDVDNVLTSGWMFLKI